MRARSDQPLDGGPGDAVPPGVPPVDTSAQSDLQSTLPPAFPEFRPGIADDLRVPWGWLEVALFAILAVIASFVITSGAAELAVRFFKVRKGAEREAA